MTTPNDPAAPAAQVDAEETPVVPAARPRRSGATTALLLVGALIAIGGVGFAAGRATATGQTGTGSNITLNGGGGPGVGPFGSFDPANFGGGLGDRALAGQSVSGTVVSVSSDSMTVQLASGQTVTIATTSSTTYHGQTSAAVTDVTTGATVTVKTTGGTNAVPGASASASSSAGTATDVTVTSK